MSPSQESPTCPLAATQLAAWRAELPPAEAAALARLAPHVQAGLLGSATPPCSPRGEALAALCAGLPTYDFDCFAFAEAAGGAPLAALLPLLFVRLRLVDAFSLDLRLLAAFAARLGAGMPAVRARRVAGARPGPEGAG